MRRRTDHNIRFLWGIMAMAFIVILVVAVIMVWVLQNQ